MGDLLHFTDCDGADPCSCDRAGLPLTTGEGNTALADAIELLEMEVEREKLRSIDKRRAQALLDALAERDALREQLDAARADSVRKNLDTLNEAFAHVPEAVKVLKVGEEFGEASEAYIGLQGLNPRKGVTHNADDVAKELADVAITALVAMEHFSASPVQTLTNRLSFVAERARAALGVEVREQEA